MGAVESGQGLEFVGHEQDLVLVGAGGFPDVTAAQIRVEAGAVADAIVECADGELAVAAYTRRGAAGLDADGPADAPDGGIKATRRIRAAWPEARILIVTEYDDPHWRAAAGQAGACGYVLKDDLLEVRRRVQAAS